MRGVKPSLSAEEKRLLELRNRLNRKRPEFRRQEWFRYKRLGEKWRRPRGLHSKMRKR
ncbi:MAG: 50S ribosomal protein L32e, partial [Thermoplasmata archaeon]|nr:50S ribosomal protein L32e [Thermoplasmata archaeon]